MKFFFPPKEGNFQAWGKICGLKDFTIHREGGGQEVNILESLISEGCLRELRSQVYFLGALFMIQKVGPFLRY